MDSSSELGNLPPHYLCCWCRADCSLQGAPMRREKRTVSVAMTQEKETGKSHTYLMSCMLLYKSLVVWIPEANTPVIGGADTDVTLPCMLTEGKARHEVFMADELTWKTQSDGYKRLIIKQRYKKATKYQNWGPSLWWLCLIESQGIWDDCLRSGSSHSQTEDVLRAAASSLLMYKPVIFQ